MDEHHQPARLAGGQVELGIALLFLLSENIPGARGLAPGSAQAVPKLRGRLRPGIGKPRAARDMGDIGIGVVPVGDLRDAGLADAHSGLTLAAVPLANASSRALAASCVLTTPATTASA